MTKNPDDALRREINVLISLQWHTVNPIGTFALSKALISRINQRKRAEPFNLHSWQLSFPSIGADIDSLNRTSVSVQVG